DLDHDGGTIYLGDYQYYIEKLEEKAAIQAKKELDNPSQSDIVAQQSNTYIDQKQQKREQRQIERKIEQCEVQIESYEQEISDLNEQLTLPDIYSNPDKANDIAIKKATAEQHLEEVMAEWAELQEMLL
ncbi:ABC transporter ATP-binding protein, partial [Staphylococcus succinus]